MSDSFPRTADEFTQKATRVDPAHETVDGEAAEADLTHWMALAGRDPAQATDQLDRQTNELLAYVQQQNLEIDSREADLNARLAQLDNEIRVTRLQALPGTGEDLLGDKSDVATSAAPSSSLRAPSAVAPHGHNSPIEPPRETSPEEIPEAVLPRGLQPGKGNPLGEFDDVEKVVAEIVGALSPETTDTEPVVSALDADIAPVVPIEETLGTLRSADSADTKDSSSLFGGTSDHQGLRSAGSGVDIGAMASSPDATALESERRLLAERKIELDRRNSNMQRIQDATQAFHREALEMRMVTEQLWAELSEKAPSNRLNQLLATLRGRLDGHYATMNQTLTDRKTELGMLKNCMRRKQQELREQSRKLQEWVECRHEAIKTHGAQLDARELLLDRREHRLQDEFAKWETQWREYKEQLDSLRGKTNLVGLNNAEPPS